MITVVTWKWRPRPDYHTTYTADHVNRLRSMVARNLDQPHEFVCVTDDAGGIDSRVRIVPLGPEVGKALHPKRPNCYRRLSAFAPNAAEWLGRRILSLDLDCVITRDLGPLVNRPEDFVIYADPAKGTPYNGSLWLLTAGSRVKVWETFDPLKAPERTQQLGIIGSDQAWIAAALGSKEATFDRRDGVLTYVRDVRKGNGGRLPDGARIVFFVGPHDPSRAPESWVKEYWK